MAVVAEDLRRSARTAFERADHHHLKMACHAILEADPDDADARRLMGLAALRDDRPDLAEAWVREAAARHPDSGTTWRDLARALVALKREAEAEAILSAASARGVRTSGSMTMLGLIRVRLDRIEDACAAFEAAIELEPTRGEAYWRLAEVGGLAPSDPVYAQLERLLEQQRFMDPAAVAARFALAEANRQAGRFESFFAQIEIANALRRKLAGRRDHSPLDPWARIRKEARPAGRLARRAAVAAGADARLIPIFLVGERCSGAALAEAMLAAEPGVFAAGEINLFGGAVMREIKRATRRADGWGVPRLSDAKRDVIRTAYLERAARMAPDARWFVDRSPGLAPNVDLLRLLFPEAAIIRVERSSVQQGLDIHRRHWPGGDKRAFDLHAVGRELRAARRAFAQLTRRNDLALCVLDAEALAASPVETGAKLRAAAGLPVSLSTFSSPRIRRAGAEMARVPEAVLAAHAELLTPLRRGLKEYGRG